MYIVWILEQLRKLKEQVSTIINMMGSITGINALTFKGVIYSNMDFPSIYEVQNGWTYEISANVIDDHPDKTNTGNSFLKNDEIAWDGSKWVTLGADPKTTISISDETEFIQAIDYLNRNNGGVIELLNDVDLGQQTINYQETYGGINFSNILLRSAAHKVHSLLLNGIVLKLKGSAFKAQDILLRSNLMNVSYNTIPFLDISEHLYQIEFNNVTFYDIIGQNSSTNPAIKITNKDAIILGMNILFYNCDIYTSGCSSNEYDSFSIQNTSPSLYMIWVRVVGQSRTRLNNRPSFKVYGNRIQQNTSNESTRRLFITDTSADLIPVTDSLLQLVYSPIIQSLSFGVYAEKSNLSGDDMFVIYDAENAGTLKKIKESTLLNHTHSASQVGLGNLSNDLQLKQASNLSDLQSSTIARINLGLGDSATKNMGNSEGTVAEGNHNHFGAYEPANGNIQNHIESIFNPHQTNKIQVGLSNVTNDLQLKAASNLSDLPNATQARNNLGLGDSATKNVGTTAGTVAAGDHTHTSGSITIPYHVRAYSSVINFKNTGVSTLFRTEANKGRFICTKCWFHADNVLTLGIYAPTFSIGHTAVNYADFISGQALPNSAFGTNQYTEVALRTQGSSRISAPASTDVKINVTQASDALIFTGTVFIEGYYLSDNL